jgi:hypothetical protein
MLHCDVDMGVSRERLVRAFNVNLSAINLLQDKQLTPRLHSHSAQHDLSPAGEGGGTDGEQQHQHQHHHCGARLSLAKATLAEQRTDVKPTAHYKKIRSWIRSASSRRR